MRRSSRRIVFSEVRFSPSLELGALQSSPGYPGRTAARPAGEPPLTGPSDVCRCPVLFPAKQSGTLEFAHLLMVALFGARRVFL